MQKLKYFTVGLISLSLLATELLWTRVFSAEFFYTFAFLIISLAIMGTSMGGLALRLFPKMNNEKLFGFYLTLSGLLSYLAPVLVFKIDLDIANMFASFDSILKLILCILILSSCYFFGGISLAILFRNNHKDMPRLYMFDLIAAGISVLSSVLLMNFAGTQYAVFLFSIPILFAAIIHTKSYFKIFPLTSVVFMFVLISNADSLLEKETKEPAKIIYKHWDAMSKIKLYEYDKSARGINIDNVANTPVYAFDGNFDTIANQNPSPWMIDVRYLIEKFDNCSFLSLGAGGGGDVLQALAYGATDVHAVEVNPHINKMLVEGDLDSYLQKDSTNYDSLVSCKDFTGGLYLDPRVKVVSEDARTYVKQFESKFDLIYSLSSNTWAALGSGSFAFAENYIFTTEAFIDYWNSMSEKGFLVMEHQIYMPRLVSSLIDALNELGIKNAEKYFAVYSMPKARRKILLLSKRELTADIIQNAFGENLESSYSFKKNIFPLNKDENNLINDIIKTGWATNIDKSKVKISPTTDLKPFVAQLGKWANFNFENLSKVKKYTVFSGFPVTKVIILIIIALLIVLFVPLVVLPYFVKGPKLSLPSWMFFFIIGAAFMIIEIVLMQKYALFIGASFYSITCVLLSLLIASGIGSRYSKLFSNKIVFGSIILWLILDICLFHIILENMSFLPIYLRSVLVSLIILPLGFFMGMPFPKASLRVGELVDWGFAVNGVASTLGASAILLIVFAYGFNIALLIGAVLYLVAYLLIDKFEW
ncbi:MAG: hypothetical protein N4A49_14505 [Marinifilaceae bacterium]|jgi:hypothetical protein|nr:hypothetical protein [Marinifilaceae bacterium]